MEVTAPISGTTRLAAVLGWPVAHSRSPALHNAAFAAAGVDAVYVALPVPPAELATVLRALAATGALGASVTVPHKEAALAACTRVDALAARAGAVNCVVFTGGEIVGHNTDAGGFVDALAEAGVVVAAGRRAVVLGGGGAARAVAMGLGDAGAEVIVVARRPEAVAWCAARAWAALADALADAALLVDATSAGLAPATELALAEQVPLERLPASAAVATLVYHRPTALLARAAAAGHVTVDGGGMLLHQAARAFALWTGQPAPLAVMRAALAG
ncbi:MAG: shikimate dehydrogenase [Kofleriaceae bacterium]|nr:shikimate dehydrogenase [Kofleriaceae bacterium]MCL4228019.1 shikimate dehydrogenase (NADP+) [Myxococcales bacterium]